jgi:hypothetical protein
MKEYVAYIDEAGDEGFGKLAAGPVGGQSRWLVLGACIVSRENDLRLPALRDQIVTRFAKRNLTTFIFATSSMRKKSWCVRKLLRFRLKCA